MGAVNPSKMPGAKKIFRKDDPNVVKKFADGGIAEKRAKDGEDIVRRMVEQYAKENPQNAEFVPKYKPPVAKKKAAASAPSTMSKQEMADMSLEMERRKQKEFEEFTAPAPVGKAKGGKVNAAGNYTKPTMRKSLFNSIKGQATQGTAAGQWSARKAQLLAKKYKAKGGGYRD